MSRLRDDRTYLYPRVTDLLGAEWVEVRHVENGTDMGLEMVHTPQEARFLARDLIDCANEIDPPWWKRVTRLWRGRR